MEPVTRKLGSVLDYGIDFSDWLEELVISDPTPDYLVSASWEVPAEIAKNAEGIIEGKIAYLWATDGANAKRGRYQLICNFSTFHGRSDKAILIMNVE